MKLSILISFLVASLVSVAGAAHFSMDGQWLVNGLVQSSRSTVCTMRFYDAEGASAVLHTLSDIPFTTDADGYFVLSGAAPSGLPDVFWVGISPKGESEISPRIKVTPVPFSLSTVRAELVKDESLIELTGTPSIDCAEISGNVAVKSMALSETGRIDVRNFTAPNLYVESISLGDCCPLGLFNAGSGASLTPNYAAMTYDLVMSASTYGATSGPLNFYVYYHDGAAERTFTAENDGFLLISVSSSLHSCPYGQLSLSSSGVSLIDGLKFGSTQRLITVPCRRNEVFRLSLLAKCVDGSSSMFATDSKYIGAIAAKVKFVYFGL